ncbi:OmpA family protein [Ectothiorhodospira lacustris]|uniref:OmpA family protein n=1 Tax=Ectothiorhodospira lacustris TaxID=2899127 RepID=UPI001EE792BB|nr:OmpA family protein [Ectothiorhodospira lacustris]MCG5501511.1 OmpA family protein [Ectothiorhodospira lacustris]MCG5510872.1 OmpA family protein [Ectothiorhodospira lacustris]MCG5522582.1 OmpA family protein [Ectothiorhodospira lacustris]
MRKTTFAGTLILASSLLAAGTSMAFADVGFASDPRGTVVRDGSGECVRTPRWSTDRAIEGCAGYVAPAPEPRVERAPPPAPAAPAPEPVYETITLGSEVLFAIGSHQLNPAATSELNRVADRIRQAGSRLERVVISGHTDNTGSRALNERLSKDRAESVKRFMVERGIPARQMETAGYAYDRPVAYNTTAEGRTANRRVEIRIEMTERVN